MNIHTLPNGQKVVQGDTHLSKWAIDKGNIITDPSVFRFLKPHLRSALTVWDIGANIGDHTRQYLDWGMQVFAFEPHPLAYECLVHNCPDARCFELAASHGPGEVKLALLDNVGASRVHADGQYVIRAAALDDLDLPAPDFVKIDVEGWEHAVLTGMAGTITRHHPILFIEMNAGALAANGVTPEAIHDTIRSLGYEQWHEYPASAKWSDPQFDVLYLPK